MSHEPPKDKKARIRDRNKKHHLVNLMAWQHESVGQSGSIAAPEFDPEKSRDAAELAEREDGEIVWSERVGTIRNRVNGKKRNALDKWNRFAGTSDGGGRGR